MVTFSNEKSLNALIASNGPVDIVVSPKTGKMFFACGDIKGAVSASLQEVIETANAEEIAYAEISQDGNTPVPCLFLRGNLKKNTIRTFE